MQKVKNNVPQTYVIYDLNGEKTVEHFMKKNCKKTNQEEFRVEKVINKKDDKLYVK